MTNAQKFWLFIVFGALWAWCTHYLASLLGWGLQTAVLITSLPFLLFLVAILFGYPKFVNAYTDDMVAHVEDMVSTLGGHAIWIGMLGILAAGSLTLYSVFGP